MAIWKDEDRFFTKDSIYSVFCIWNSYDSNCCPTFGEVSSRYELEVSSDNELILVPKTFHFTTYTEDYHPSWSAGNY
ncbi:MAG: hypothetical protein LBG19_07760 [Prevotellaceae bacterium]|nr:hypothetical protein [Prevotellaceae bacterium]